MDEFLKEIIGRLRKKTKRWKKLLEKDGPSAEEIEERDRLYAEVLELEKQEEQARKLEEIDGRAERDSGPFQPAPGPAPVEGDRSDSRPYSLLRIARAIRDRDWSHAKLERDIHEKLEREGYRTAEGGTLVPIGPARLEGAHPALKSAGLRQLMQIEPPRQAGASERRTNILGLDSKGGIFKPALYSGELIELLRANMALSRELGVRFLQLPPSGKLSWPKQKGGAVFFWMGDPEQELTSQDLDFGSVSMDAKKLGAIVGVSNDVLRIDSPDFEAIVRQDFAEGGALAQDAAALEGKGGKAVPLGIINHPGLQTHVAGTVGANGDTFEPEDPALMVGKVEEADSQFTGWVMRPLMYSQIKNRRADAVNAGDKQGPFLFDVARGAVEGQSIPLRGALEGYPANRTTQVSNTRSKGAASNLTYILGGDYRNLMIGTVGVMEIAISDALGFAKDQTHFRTIMQMDTANRHEEAYVMADALLAA